MLTVTSDSKSRQRRLNFHAMDAYRDLALLSIVNYIYLRKLILYMRFRKIGIFFIVLATAVMMAHSVIPHHHHYELTDFNSGCQHECPDQRINDQSEESGHDSYCSLNQEILIPGKSVRSGEDLQDERSVPGFFPLMNDAVLTTDPLSISSCASSTYLPENSSQYLFLLSSPRGLRAPPLS
jgi:hypothetical protein